MTRRVHNDSQIVRSMFRLTAIPPLNVALVLCWWPIATVLSLNWLFFTACSLALHPFQAQKVDDEPEMQLLPRPRAEKHTGTPTFHSDWERWGDGDYDW